MGKLTDKYCIVGIGETEFARNSNRSTLSLACEAIRRAAADAGLPLSAIDGLTSYQTGDSTSSDAVAHAMGLELNYGVDVIGGAAAPEFLITHAMGLIEQGSAKCVAVYRAMNGRTGRRPGGRGKEGPTVANASGKGQYLVPAGMNGAVADYALYAMRYLYEYGYNTDVFGHVAVTQRRHAQMNPKALRKEPMQLKDHHESRWINKPFRLFDCCQEVDNAVCAIVVDAEWARNLAQPPVYIRGGIGRSWSEDPFWEWGRRRILEPVAGRMANKLFELSDTAPSDVDIFGMYDNFSVSPLLWWEAMGYCARGEGGAFIDGGRAIDIDGAFPQNTSGGQLSETYTHGFNLILENVRQLRGRVDDHCPDCATGVHSFDRSKGCRQALAKSARGKPTAQAVIPEISLNVGTGNPRYFSGLVLRR